MRKRRAYADLRERLLKTRNLAALAVVLLILVAGVAVLYAARPPVLDAVDSTSAASSANVVVTAPPTPGDPCASIQQADLQPGIQTSFPARTAAEVLSNSPKDPAMRHWFEDIAGVRPGPLGDARVPRCRLDLLRLGDPVFVRRYPATTGSWLVPIVFAGETLDTVYVSVDSAGMGRVGGGRGGVIPIPTEAEARAAGALPGDAVIDAQLIFAIPPGCGATLTAVWRLVRARGSVVTTSGAAEEARPRIETRPSLISKQSPSRLSSDTE